MQLEQKRNDVVSRAVSVRSYASNKGIDAGAGPSRLEKDDSGTFTIEIPHRQDTSRMAMSEAGGQ
jgi:hypothetical protein